MPAIKTSAKKSARASSTRKDVGTRLTVKKPIVKAKVAAKTKVAVKRAVKAKAKTAKTMDLSYSPIKTKLNRAQIVDAFVNAAEITPKQGKLVLAELEQLIFGSLRKGSVGHFQLPGILDIKARKIPAKKIAAIKKGTMVKNPFNGGKEEPHKGRPASIKPATVKPRVRPLAKLRTVVLA